MRRGHAHLRDGLSSVGWDLLCSTHVPNLKRVPATKILKSTPNVKILILSQTRRVFLSPFISKASRRVYSFFPSVQHSQPYVATW